MTSTSPELRMPFARILRTLVVFLLAVMLAGAVVGYLVEGSAGVWAAVLAIGVTALTVVVTVAVMLFTADRPIHVTTAAFGVSWVVKIALMFVVLLLVRDRDFYSPGVFFITFCVALLGSLVIEVHGAATARVPHVTPRPADSDSESPGHP